MQFDHSNFNDDDGLMFIENLRALSSKKKIEMIRKLEIYKYKSKI